MTLGATRRSVEALEKAMVALEDRVQEMDEANPQPWVGNERRRDALFSDAQVEWLKLFHEDRSDIKAGRAFYRLLFYVACAAATGTGSVLFAYFKLKG